MADESELVKARIALIAELREAGMLWKLSAESAALGAIRNPRGQEAVVHAREMVIRHDTREAMADEAIKLVWKYWPRDEAQQKTDPPATTR
jgi:hypothetical protein